MMRKINYLLISFVFILIGINLISAEANPCGSDNSFLGTFSQGTNITLKQICSTCTYINLSSIKYPNSTIINYGTSMTKSNVDFTYSFSDTNNLGCYTYSVFGNKVTIEVESIDFEITTTGEKVSLSNTIIVIVFIIMALFFLYLGSIFDKEKWIVKTAFYIFAILMGLLAVNSAKIIASESMNLSAMGTAGFILMIAVLLFMLLYILITTTINVFKQIKNKREVRWNY